MDHRQTIVRLMREAKAKIRSRIAQNRHAAWTLFTDPVDILDDPAYGHARDRQERRRLLREVQKEYDIRGFVSRDPRKPKQPAVNFPLALAFRIGAALASARFSTHKGEVGLAPGDVFLLGRDNGPDSASRAEAVARGLAVAGVNVVSLGVSPSGELYNAVANLGAQGGAQITRSHVEINVNGIKMIVGGVTLFGDHIKEIFDWVEANRYRRMTRAEDHGAIFGDIPEAAEIQRLRYEERYANVFDPRCPVAIDLGGGTAVKYRDTFTCIFPTVVRFFREQDDPLSLNGLADPTRLDQRENYAEALDFSLAHPEISILSFDLDADRFGLMINGEVLKGDLMMLPIYEEQIKRKPKTPCRIDARTNMVVDEAVRHWGGTSIAQAIGHSKVKRAMDLDTAAEAKAAGYDRVDRYVQEHPAPAETFQGEFSLHMFRFKPEPNDEGVYVGTPVDDAIDFAFYFMQTMQRRGKALGKPCLQLPEYLALLNEQGIIGSSYLDKRNTKEIRTEYDPHLKKNLGHAAFELMRRIARPGEKVSWIDDGVSAISADSKLMIRYSNTSPKVTMKCDAKSSRWITEAERLLGIYYGITDYLISHRGMDKAFRAIGRGENEFLYEAFEAEGKSLETVAPVSLAGHQDDPEFRQTLDQDY
jgi:phosphomannomutase